VVRQDWRDIRCAPTPGGGSAEEAVKRASRASQSKIPQQEEETGKDGVESGLPNTAANRKAARLTPTH